MSDILQYSMNNTFIMYCSCLNTMVKSLNICITYGEVIAQLDNPEDMESIALRDILFILMFLCGNRFMALFST